MEIWWVVLTCSLHWTLLELQPPSPGPGTLRPLFGTSCFGCKCIVESTLPFHDTEASQTGNCKQAQSRISAVQDRNLKSTSPSSSCSLFALWGIRKISTGTNNIVREEKMLWFLFCIKHLASPLKELCFSLEVQKKTSPIKSSFAALGWFLLGTSVQQFHSSGQTSSSEKSFV